jgi:hypothetical protein
VLAAWWLWPRRERRGLAAATIGVLGSIVLVAIGYWVLYLPLTPVVQSA